MKMKAKILTVGKAYRDESGNQVLTDWQMDARGGPGITVDKSGEGGLVGYTFEELEEIASKHRA